MTIAMFLTGFVLSVIVLFMGMFISAKLTGFSISATELLMVVMASTLVGAIPTLGAVLSLLVMYALLKRFSDGQGIMLMMISSFILTLILGSSMMDTISHIKLSL